MERKEEEHCPLRILVQHLCRKQVTHTGSGLEGRPEIVCSVLFTNKSNDLFYECYVCMYVNVPHAHLVPSGRKRASDPWYRMVNHHVLLRAQPTLQSKKMV